MLNNLPFGEVRRTYQISGENPTGGKGCGNIPFDGQKCETLVSRLKVHPFVYAEPGETITLAEIRGSGSINEFFFTTETHVHVGETLLYCLGLSGLFHSAQCALGSSVLSQMPQFLIKG